MIDAGWCREADQQARQPRPRRCSAGPSRASSPRRGPPGAGDRRRPAGGAHRGPGEAPGRGRSPSELVEATLPHLSPQVAAMVRLQRLTGGPAAGDRLDAGRATSTAPTRAAGSTGPAGTRPSTTGGTAVDHLGPQAREVLCALAGPRPRRLLLQPGRGRGGRNAAARARRRSPLTPSQARGRPKAGPEAGPGRPVRQELPQGDPAGLPEGWASPSGFPTSCGTRGPGDPPALRAGGGQAVLGHSETGTTRSTPSAIGDGPAGHGRDRLARV